MSITIDEYTKQPFDNKAYLKNELEKHRMVLAGLVQQAVENDEPLDSFIIQRQEDTVERFVQAVKDCE